MVSNTGLGSFRIQGGWIYFNDYSEFYTRGIERLARARLDGSARQILSTGEAYIHDLDDGWLYYRDFSDSGSLYRIRIDGSQRMALSEGPCGFIELRGSRIYYYDFSDGGRVYSMRTDGSDKRRLQDGAARLADGAATP